jgi:hypothetical protein
MSDFRIIRDHLDSTPTTGHLYASDLELYTLELPWQDNHPNFSCIPVGTYQCIVAGSLRFGRLMPRLLDVPNRDGILIHPGNTEVNTEGCILVGTGLQAGPFLTNSRVAWDEFFEWLNEEIGSGPVNCQISVAGEVADGAN